MTKGNEEIIQYLESVIELEQAQYIQERMIDDIDASINKLGRSAQIREKTVKEANFGETVGLTTLLFGFLGLIIGGVIGYFSTWEFFDRVGRMLSTGIRYCLYAAVIGLAIGFCRYFYELKKESVDRKIAEQEFANEQARDLMRVNAEKEQASRLRVLKEKLVKQESITYDLLQEYYEIDILYPSYRNFTAVCSICEYLKSGKCATLQGYDGAYVLYDNERRLDRIVDRLDVIVVKLEEIKKTQFMLYSAIQEGNRMSNKILQETYKQTQLQSFSAEQNAISAYNTQLIASEAKMSNWLKSYELYHSGV